MLLHFPNLVMGPGLNGSGACAEKNVTHTRKRAQALISFTSVLYIIKSTMKYSLTVLKN